jgi:hypothetical protein
MEFGIGSLGVSRASWRLPLDDRDRSVPKSRPQESAPRREGKDTLTVAGSPQHYDFTGQVW